MSQSQQNTSGEQLPADELVQMSVRALPTPNVMFSNPKDVARIRRSIKGSRGYRPAEGDEPITLLRREGRLDTLINGNHRTEALKTADGFLDVEVPVLITHRVPENLPTGL